MEALNKLILISHIGAGFIALSLFWIQAFSRKGGANHAKVGKLYVNLMWVVVGSAVMLCILNFIGGRVIIAAFLMFIALITAKPLWLGTAILRAKNAQRTGRDQSQVKAYRVSGIIFNLAIVLAGIAMIAYGLYLGGQGFAVLLMIFGGLGLISVFELWSSARMLESPDLSEWIKAHIVGMGTSGIAAHTAFLVFGANRFLPESITQSYWSFVPWLAPAVVGTILIRIAVTKYQPQSAVKPPKPSMQSV